MKKLTILLLVLSILLTGSGYAFAWSPQLKGQPEQFRPGDSRGVFIWRNHDGLHLRTTTRGREHVFSGVIRTDGRFVDVDSVRLEGRDFFRLNDNNNMIFFRFRTEGGVDGLDFRVWGDQLNVALYVDGHRIDPEEIYIGHRGWHPDDNEFRLR